MTSQAQHLCNCDTCRAIRTKERQIRDAATAPLQQAMREHEALTKEKFRGELIAKFYELALRELLQHDLTPYAAQLKLQPGEITGRAMEYAKISAAMLLGVYYPEKEAKDENPANSDSDDPGLGAGNRQAESDQ